MKHLAAADGSEARLGAARYSVCLLDGAAAPPGSVSQAVLQRPKLPVTVVKHADAETAAAP